MEFKENIEFTTLPKFYQHLIHFLSEFSCGESITPSIILSESMCHNRFVKIGKEVISCSYLNLDKLLFVADFFDLTGNLKTWQHFKADFNIPNSIFLRLLRRKNSTHTLFQHWVDKYPWRRVLFQVAPRAVWVCVWGVPFSLVLCTRRVGFLTIYTLYFL